MCANNCRRAAKYFDIFTDNLARIRSVLYYGLQYFSYINFKLFFPMIKNYLFTYILFTHCVSNYVYPSKSHPVNYTEFTIKALYITSTKDQLGFF